MKKILFFLFCFFLPTTVLAESITDLEVLNGTLSIPFNKDNNLYSVTLNDNEEELKLSYDLKDTDATVDILKEDNKTILHVLNSDHSEENYVFYINKKEEATPVFKETYEEDEKPKEIPHLKLYVSLTCFFIIVILFKFIVL